MVSITPELKEALKEQLKQFPQLTEKQRTQMIAQIDAGEGMVHELMGIKPSMLEFIYSQALQAYERRDLKKANSIFYFLNLLNASDPRFMMGIAAIAQLKKDYETALFWYMLADQFMDRDPMISCYISECYGNTNQNWHKKFYLEIAVERCEKDSHYDTLKERIKMMLTGLEDLK